MPENFKTWGDAVRYCQKYGLSAVASMTVFELAECLLLAYNDGRRKRELELEKEAEKWISKRKTGGKRK